MSESTERPLFTIMGLIITIGVVVLILYLYFMQRGLGIFTETKQAQELEKLLGGVLTVCGDSTHPDVKNLYINVYGGYWIQYKNLASGFGGLKAENAKRYGCNKNCLCAFNGDKVVQCVSMFTQEKSSCQDISIKQSGGLGSDLMLPTSPSKTVCKYQLKLTWDGSTSPPKVLVEITHEKCDYTMVPI